MGRASAHVNGATVATSSGFQVRPWHRRLADVQVRRGVHQSQTRTSVAVAIRNYELPDVADSNAIRLRVFPGARSQSVGTAAAFGWATSSPPSQFRWP